MPVVMVLHWPESTVEHYEEARQKVGWEVDPPAGGIHHTAWFAYDGMHVVDVWETAEDFHRFADERLMPVVKGEIGVPGEPIVQIFPTHAVFVADTAHALASQR